MELYTKIQNVLKNHDIRSKNKRDMDVSISENFQIALAQNYDFSSSPLCNGSDDMYS